MKVNERVMGLYRRALSLVCRETNVSEYELLGCNEAQCSDARYVLVMALSLYLTDTEIAYMIGHTRQGVNFLRNNRKAMKKDVKDIYEKVSKELASE